MPRVGQLSATDVWAAVTRTLSALTGQPRTDLVGSDAALWSAVTRTLTKISLEDDIDQALPASNYKLDPAMSNSATGDTFGSWVQAVANVGSGKRLLWVYLTLASDVGGQGELEAGEGGSGSEAAIFRAPFHIRQSSAVGYMPEIWIPMFVALSASARLSFRVRDNVGSAKNYGLAIMVA